MVVDPSVVALTDPPEALACSNKARLLMVAEPPAPRSSERQRLLDHEVEQLVVEARRVGLDLAEVLAAIEARWRETDPSNRGT